MTPEEIRAGLEKALGEGAPEGDNALRRFFGAALANPQALVEAVGGDLHRYEGVLIEAIAVRMMGELARIDRRTERSDPHESFYDAEELERLSRELGRELAQWPGALQASLREALEHLRDLPKGEEVVTLVLQELPPEPGQPTLEEAKAAMEADMVARCATDSLDSVVRLWVQPLQFPVVREAALKRLRQADWEAVREAIRQYIEDVRDFHPPVAWNWIEPELKRLRQLPDA